MEFSERQKKLLLGEKINLARLAEFNFKSGIQRYWPGHVPLYDQSGTLWNPTMGVGAVTGIRQSYNGTAPELKFELSGVDRRFMRIALASGDEYYNRLVRVLWQFFDKDWTTIGPPIVMTWGLMKTMTSKRETEEMVQRQSLVLSGESPFEGRARARNSYLTDTDQRRRSPGDEICSRIAGIETKLITFPAF